jgi:hypothetical protein
MKMQNDSGRTQQVTFGIMVSKGNIDQAEATAKSFSQVAVKGDQFGIQTDDLIRDQAPLKEFIDNRRSEPWDRVFVWDKQCDDAWRRSEWPASLPQPFYTGSDIFSYTGSLNRLLALALVAKAPVLVRVDAGTAPMGPSAFGADLDKHLTLLDMCAVVSGGYSGRIALRDLKGAEEVSERSRFHAIIKRRTDVDPLNQLTGGACFALRPEVGPPAIAFPGVLPVWASDDAFFQGAARTFVNASMIVKREGGGQPLTEPEYLARLACAAALAAIHKQAKLSLSHIPVLDTVIGAGRDFLDELRSELPAAVRASDHGSAQRRLQERALGLIEGYENYVDLKARWSEVGSHIASIGTALPLDA